MVDVADSKSADGDIVWVRVPPPAPRQKKPTALRFRRDGESCVFVGSFFLSETGVSRGAPVSVTGNGSDLNCPGAPPRQKKPTALRFRRGGESSVFVGSFFLSETGVSWGLPFRYLRVRIWIALVHHVRRTQFRSVSAVCVSAWRRAGNVRRTRLAAKTAHPLRPSSFPKRESHGDSRFGYGERFGLEFPLFPVPRLRREMIRCAQTRKGIPVFNTETS